MAEEIKIEELVDVPGVVKGLTDINKVLDQMVKNLDVELRDAIKVLNQVKVSDAKSLKEYNAAMVQAERVTQQKIKTTQLQLKTEQQLAKARADEAKALEKQAKAAADEAKAKEKQARATENLNNVYKQESKRLNDLRNDYKNLAAQGRENGKVAKGLLQEITALDSKLKSIDATVGQHQRNVGNYNGILGELKNRFTSFISAAGVISGVIKGFRDFVNVNREFEASLKNLSAITGATGKDLEFYSQKALELGNTTKGGAKAVVEAFKLIGSAKPELLSNKAALADVTEQAILLSKAAGLEVPDAATRLTDALNQFGAPASDAAKYVDILGRHRKRGQQKCRTLPTRF